MNHILKVYKSAFRFSFVLLVFILSSALFQQSFSQELYLNEIMASNSETIADEDGDYEDWIEIFYNGEEPLNLEGFGLSDDYERPFRWIFPDITVQPGEYLLIWASGKNRGNPSGELHTNFSISAAGEEVFITNTEHIRLDELEPINIPTDLSYGRYPDGTGDWRFFTTPTPGQANQDEGFSEFLEPPSFSHNGGFYADDFEVSITHPDPNVTILYTLDGSEPDPDNIGGQTYEHMRDYRPLTGSSDLGDLETRSFESFQYDGSILISDRTGSPNRISNLITSFNSNPDPSDDIFKGTVVRAKVIKDGAVSSPVETHTYFVTPELNNRFTLPVISFAIQEDYLFDYHDGIYVPGAVYGNSTNTNGNAPANQTQRGIEWERPGSMEIFTHDKNHTAYKSNLGVRIHGGWSRASALKSLRLYARGQYGESRFNYPFFPDLEDDSFNRIMLRNSGNDWDRSYFRDAAMQAFVKHMNVDTQAYQPYIIFINGEYWGMLNARERYDKHYLERVHGINPDNIDLIDQGGPKEGDRNHYDETLSYMNENDMSEPEHYEYIKTRIDVQNYADYKIAQIYLRNTDWPHNNIDFWRYRNSGEVPKELAPDDGRWRWLLYDTDFGFNLYGNSPTHNTLNHTLSSSHWAAAFLPHLMENIEFRNYFISRFLDQLNTAFLPERITAIIDDMSAVVEPEINEHMARWSTPYGYNYWANQVSDMKDFAHERPDYVRSHLRSYAGSIGTRNLTLDISDQNAGTIQLNTIAISPETTGIDENPWPWSGVYLSSIPVTLYAIPNDGYAFSHWEGENQNYYNSSLSLTLRTHTDLKAVFIPREQLEIFPVAHDLHTEDYVFDYWPADAAKGTYPANMAFVFTDTPDPDLQAGIAGFTEGAFNLDSRTRINGLGSDGFSFINTASEEGNPGYPGTKLGGAIVTLNTNDTEEVTIRWHAGTIAPNSRRYNIRLQYRTDVAEEFQDLLLEDGTPVEYQSNDQAGHSQWIGPMPLPDELYNQYNLQLMWRYYYSGEQTDEDSGQRSELAIHAIEITMDPTASETETDSTDVHIGKIEIPESYNIEQNYPNPFNPVTVINYQLPVNSEVRLEVFDVLGRRVALLQNGQVSAGHHTATFDATDFSSGVYIYRLRAGDFIETRQMMLVK